MNDWIFLVEMLLVFGSVMAFATWELIKLHRDDDSKNKQDD